MEGNIIVDGKNVAVSYSEDKFAFKNRGSKLKLISNRTKQCLAKFNLKKKNIVEISEIDLMIDDSKFLVISDLDNYGMKMDVYSYGSLDLPNTKWFYESFNYKSSLKGIFIKKIHENLYLIHKENADELYVPHETFSSISSGRHHKVYYDSMINEQIGSGILLIEDKYVSEYNPNLCDIVTYGIDYKTGEVVTPLYSKLQGRFFSTKYRGVDGIVIYEILAALNSKLNKLDEVYDAEGKLNNEFVKKFKRNTN